MTCYSHCYSSYHALSYILCEVYAAKMRHPLETRYYQDRWKQTIDVMLEKIMGILRSDKLQIIQLLEADIKQVLHVAFARNITKSATHHDCIITEHHHGRTHPACMTPVLNTWPTVQLLIQKRTAGILFDNDANGRYAIIIILITLEALRIIGTQRIL
jgi:hypothetical protein